MGGGGYFFPLTASFASETTASILMNFGIWFLHKTLLEKYVRNLGESRSCHCGDYEEQWDERTAS
jgi:hypothetical protein